MKAVRCAAWLLAWWCGGAALCAQEPTLPAWMRAEVSQASPAEKPGDWYSGPPLEASAERRERPDEPA